MTSGYPTARLVAPTVVEHLAGHRAAVAARGFRTLGPAPDADAVEQLIAAGFWASLQREEGRDPQISLAWLPPEQAKKAMLFERPLTLEPHALAKLAPAVERPGIHLGVWMEDGELRVWGAMGAVPTLTFVLEVMAPGQLVLKYRRGDELDKYGTIAVLEGDRAQIIDEAGASLPDCPDLLVNLLGFESAGMSVGTNVLVQLAISMRSHRRGGSLIVVPHESTAWRESTAQPIVYAVQPYPGLADLLCAYESEVPEDGPATHARFYGTFPRKIRRYAMEHGALTVEDAVRSMTSLPAQIMGLSDRGLLREGMAADVVVLDLARIRDRATFVEPHQYPEGIELVLVGGVPVVDGEKLTWKLPGKVLARDGRSVVAR
jgi:hypothetical protein